jgi:hypothetical protein
LCPKNGSAKNGKNQCCEVALQAKSFFGVLFRSPLLKRDVLYGGDFLKKMLLDNNGQVFYGSTGQEFSEKLLKRASGN